MSYNSKTSYSLFSKQFLNDIDSEEDEDNNFDLCLDYKEDESITESKSFKPKRSRNSMYLPARPTIKPLLPNVNPSPYNLFRKSTKLEDKKLSPKHLNLVATQKQELTCTENEDDDLTSQEEKSKQKVNDIHNIGLFRKTMKSVKKKFNLKQKYKDFESIWINENFVLEKLDEDRYSIGENKKYFGRFSGRLPTINEKHGVILNFLEKNARRINSKKKLLDFNQNNKNKA